MRVEIPTEGVLWPVAVRIELFCFFIYTRCVEMVKSSQYVELANDLEISKAITYLRQKEFNQVSLQHMNGDVCTRLCRYVFLLGGQSFSGVPA